MQDLCHAGHVSCGIDAMQERCHAAEDVMHGMYSIIKDRRHKGVASNRRAVKEQRCHLEHVLCWIGVVLDMKGL
jgi:hypothetical protein